MPGLAEHATAPYGSDQLGYPWGVSALDADLDGDLELFLGGGGPGASAACLYENRSSPGDLRFARSVCMPADARVFGGFPLELDGAPPRELLVVGDGVLELWSWAPGLERVDLTTLPDRPEGCRLVALAALDTDSDGDHDALLACAGRFPLRGRLSVQPDARLENLAGEVSWAEPVGDGGNTLALGVDDTDGDGRLDVSLIVDTFSSPTERNTLVDPGGVAMRQVPPSTDFTVAPFTADTSAWGSFMGTGMLRLPDGERLRVLSDFGPVRALDAEGQDRAPALGLTEPYPGETPLFSWGVLVDDYNRDAADDVLFTLAAVTPASEDRVRAHVSRVALGGAGGRFVAHGERVGLTLAANSEAAPRSALRADLDRDGQLDLVFGVTSGPFRIWTVESGDTPRCAVQVEPFHACAIEGGVAFGPGEDGPWSSYATLGQIGVGALEEVNLPNNRGAVRFASGWVAPYDCEGGPGPVRVIEPEWPALTREEGVLRLIAPEGWRDATWQALGRRGREDVEVRLEADGDGWRIVGDADALLLQADGVWLDRWRDVPR